MKNQNNQTPESLRMLLLHVVKLKTEIEGSNDSIVFRSSLRIVLTELERELSAKSLNTKKLSQGAFGIFRLVTESSELENSPLGKDLLELRHQIRDFISSTGDN